MSINIHNAYMYASYSLNRLDKKVNSFPAEGRSLYIPTHWSAKFLSTGISGAAELGRQGRQLPTQLSTG